MSGQVVRREIQGFQMYLRPSDGGLSRILNKRQERGEHCFMWILKREAWGEVGMDLGANIGYTTMPMCKQMGEVIAIEPDPRTRDLLKRSIKENGFEDNTHVFGFAISDKGGTGKLSLSSKPNQSSLRENQKNKVGEVEVSLTTVDDLMQDLGIDLNFIKMDIEGLEAAALRGAMGSLERTQQCKILIEVHPQFFKGDEFEKVLRELSSYGYRIKYVVSAAVPRPDLFRKHDYHPMKGAPLCMNRRHNRAKRAIYNSISQDHAIEWSSYSFKQKYPGGVSPKIVRSILLVKERKL